MSLLPVFRNSPYLGMHGGGLEGSDHKQLWFIIFLSFTELHMLGPTFLFTDPPNEDFIFSRVLEFSLEISEGRAANNQGSLCVGHVEEINFLLGQ